jgi:hypothetical protein
MNKFLFVSIGAEQFSEFWVEKLEILKKKVIRKAIDLHLLNLNEFLPVFGGKSCKIRGF